MMIGERMVSLRYSSPFLVHQTSPLHTVPGPELDRRTPVLPDGRSHRILQILSQSMAIKNVITQNQGHGILPNKLSADHKRLSNPSWIRLHGIVDI